jgi:hypothetical protein
MHFTKKLWSEFSENHVDDLAQFIKHHESFEAILIAGLTMKLHFKYRYFPCSEQITYMQKTNLCANHAEINIKF